MDVQPVVVIDLAEYGLTDGSTIEMSEPTFRRMNDMKNAIRRCIAGAKISKDNPLTAEDVAFGDMEIIAIMAYVKRGPFKPTVEGFLDFTDKLDEIKIGNGNALFDKMKDVAEKLKGGEESPLPN